MRIAVSLLLVGLAGCGSAAPDAPQGTLASSTVDARAPIAAFVPPTPAGCAAAARSYDVCFAFDGATPLALRVALPPELPANAVGIVRFVRASGVREHLQLDQLKFAVDTKPELRLYFQIYPGAYRIEIGVDSDGDGDPDGPNDLRGWSALSPDVAVFEESDAAIVDVGLTPIETAFRLAQPK